MGNMSLPLRQAVLIGRHQLSYEVVPHYSSWVVTVDWAWARAGSDLGTSPIPHVVSGLDRAVSDHGVFLGSRAGSSLLMLFMGLTNGPRVSSVVTRLEIGVAETASKSHKPF